MKFFIGLVFVLSAPLELAAQTRAVVKLQADVWCPFNCKDTDKNPGYMIEIAKAAFDTINTDVEYKNIAWNTAIDRARKGITNGIIGAAPTDAPDFIYTPTPLGRTNNCLFTLPESKWTFTDGESLKKVRVGVIEGYTYGDIFENHVRTYLAEKEKRKAKEKDPKVRDRIELDSLVQTVPGDNSLALNIKKLTTKPSRIEAFVEEVNVVKNYLYSNNLPVETYRNAGCLEPDTASIAFGPKDPKGKEYAKLLSDTAAAMRKDGRLKKILDKYGISDWEK